LQSDVSRDRKFEIINEILNGDKETAVAVLNEFVTKERDDEYLLLEAVEGLKLVGNQRSAEIMRHAFYEDETMPEWTGYVYSQVDCAIKACESR
jgi:hypothetical protein